MIALCFYCCGKTKKQKTPPRTRFVLGSRLWGIRVHGAGAAAEDHVFKHYQQAARTNWEWHGALFLSLKAPPHPLCDKPLPAKPHLLTVPKTKLGTKYSNVHDLLVTSHSYHHSGQYLGLRKYGTGLLPLQGSVGCSGCLFYP